jgi:hypothetical protein
MSDFTALPVYDGVGPYHFNRYRVVFFRPPGVTKEALASDFVSSFPHYFNNPHASVDFRRGRNFNGVPVLEFHGVMDHLRGLNIHFDMARPHNDWVAQVWSNVSIGFTAQTLKREFWVAGEDLAAAGGGGVAGGLAGGKAGSLIYPGVGTAVGAVVGGASALGLAVHWNRMHFLAGRRSWRLDDASAFGITPQNVEKYDRPADLCVLETTAVERFSSRFFVAGDLAFALEDAIPPIWTANLGNFVQMRGLTTIDPDSPLAPLWGFDTWRWRKDEPRLNVYYYRDQFDTLEALKSDPEFQKAFRLFPTILP